jgi:hypothetical protein
VGVEVCPRTMSSDQQEIVVHARVEAEHVGDEEQRQRSGDVPDEVALAPFADAVDDLVAHGADVRGALGDALGGEPLVDEGTTALVLGVVHADAQRQRLAVRARCPDAREPLGIALDGQHVLVPGDRPDVVLLVVVRGRVLAHPRPGVVGFVRVPPAVEQVDVVAPRVSGRCPHVGSRNRVLMLAENRGIDGVVPGRVRKRSRDGVLAQRTTVPRSRRGLPTRVSWSRF